MAYTLYAYDVSYTYGVSLSRPFDTSQEAIEIPAPAAPSQNRRQPLSRERVLRAAVALADEGGFESLTMRKLAKELGVEAMSLYNHVANKDDLLDGMIDIVFSEIEPRRRRWIGRRPCGNGRFQRETPSRDTVGRSA